MFNTGKIIVSIDLKLTNEDLYRITEDCIDSLSIMNLSQCYGLNRESLDEWYECDEFSLTVDYRCRGLAKFLINEGESILWASIKYEDGTDCMIEVPFSLNDGLNNYQSAEINADESTTIVIKK